MGTFYTTDTLVGLVRDRLDDESEPYLVSDDTLASFIDFRQREYCTRTLCLTDSDSYTITLAADTPRYAVDARIMKVREGWLTTGKKLVEAVTKREIEDVYYTHDYGTHNRRAWRTATGEPRYMVTDVDTGYVRMVPIPTAVDTIELDVYLNPASITDVSDALSLEDDLAQELIPGILASCYGMHDAQIYDPEEEKKWIALWERTLTRRSATNERNLRGPGNVRFNRGGVW